MLQEQLKYEYFDYNTNEVFWSLIMTLFVPDWSWTCKAESREEDQQH